MPTTETLKCQDALADQMSRALFSLEYAGSSFEADNALRDITKLISSDPRLWRTRLAHQVSEPRVFFDWKSAAQFALSEGSFLSGWEKRFLTDIIKIDQLSERQALVLQRLVGRANGRLLTVAAS